MDTWYCKTGAMAGFANGLRRAMAGVAGGYSRRRFAGFFACFAVFKAFAALGAAGFVVGFFFADRAALALADRANRISAAASVSCLTRAWRSGPKSRGC